MSEQIHDVYRSAGFRGRLRLGDRPAMLVVDFSCGFTDPDSPLGSNVDDAVMRTRQVLDESRRHGVLNVFTSIGYEPGLRDGGPWVRKVPSLGDLVIGSRWVELDPRLGRLEGEPLLVKRGVSAFFGTHLSALLAAERIDTVFVFGATTSGCVRASAVDAIQYGFDTFVVVDCVVDRHDEPHRANLFDITAKYADPVTAEEVIAYLQKVKPSGEEPKR